MRLRLQFVATALALSAALSCSTEAPESPSDGTWVGTITTEGNVTTVVNESGSVWGGTARLVEEASIGVESGPDEYMFGNIATIQADERRIYVIDSQLPAVRVYTLDGAFLHNVGAEGQGPGEFMHPNGLAVDAMGRILVLDTSLRRINVHESSGAALGSWPISTSLCCRWPMYSLGEQSVWVPVREWVDRERGVRRYGAQAVGPDGPYDEPVWLPELTYEAATYVFDGREWDAPLGPSVVWNPAPDGRLVAGASDRYHFEIHWRDGSTLVVERRWEPEPIAAGQREWERRFHVAFKRATDFPELNWDGDGMPDEMPAFDDLAVAKSGEIWVFRAGASVRLPGCIEDPLEAGVQEAAENRCWDNPRITEVFGPDGRYLGTVELPVEVEPFAKNFFANNGVVIARSRNARGFHQVKRYRLVLPAEEQ